VIVSFFSEKRKKKIKRISGPISVRTYELIIDPTRWGRAAAAPASKKIFVFGDQHKSSSRMCTNCDSSHGCMKLLDYLMLLFSNPDKQTASSWKSASPRNVCSTGV
jgi:hypothetical protein